jgi:hypothetical protein
MFKTRALGAVLVVLALSGCSAAAVESAPPAETPTQTTAPLVPDEPTPTAAASGAVEDGEEQYLSSMHNGLVGMDDAADESLIAAGHDACDQLATGVTHADVDVIEGDAPGEPRPGYNDQMIADIASQTLCVEFSETS